MTRFLFTAGGTDLSGAPAEIEVLYKGKFNHPSHGDFEITDRDLEELVANQGTGIDAQIDVDHKASKGDTRAAGWIKSVRRDGDRLYAAVEWTPYGQGLVSTKEYRYISAEYGNVRDDATGKYQESKRLRAATLTNRPFLKALKPLTLSDDADHEVILDSMAHCSVHDSYQATCEECQEAVQDDEQSETQMSAQDLANARYMLAVGSIGGTKLGKLPNSSYAWVDSSGVGHLPYKNADGKVDAAHTRNALARLNQVKGLSGDTAARVRQKLEAALRSVGGSPGSDDHQNGDDMPDSIRAALHLSDDASEEAVVAAISKLAEPAEGFVTLADHEKTVKALDTVMTRLEDSEKSQADLLRDTYLTEQLRAGKVAPSEMDDLRELFDVAPDKVKGLVEKRKPNALLTTLGHGEDDTATVGDVLKTGANVHREGLHEATLKLMSADPKLDYGEAMIMAEKAGQSA